MSNSQSSESDLPIINSVSEFLKCIEDITIKEGDATKRSEFLFRGQECAKWKVESSAYRRLKIEVDNQEVPGEYELYYNSVLIEQFKHADLHSGYPSKIMELDLGILAQLQHNGAATSLIDFSGNPLISLWFACQKSPEPDSDGKVFVLSTSNESEFEEINTYEQIKDYSLKVPEQLHLGEVYGILNNKKTVYWKPAHLNKRIAAQQSYFLIGKRKLPGMKEITIIGSFKSKILKELSSVYGINELTLYPDLVGFAQVNSIYPSYGKEEKQERKRIIIRNYDQIIAKDSKDSQSYNDRGIAKYHFDDYKGAIEDFNIAIKDKKNNIDIYSNRGSAKYKLGNVKIKSNNHLGAIKDYKDAIEDFNKAIDGEPKNALNYNSRGFVKSELGGIKHEVKYYTESIEDYTKAITMEPDYVYSYNNRGRAQFVLGDAKREVNEYYSDYYKHAIKDFEKAIKMEPDSANFYYNRGLTRFVLEEYKDSIEDFNKSIKINSKHLNSYYYRGAANYILTNYKDAIDDYQKAIKLSHGKDLTGIINEDLQQIQEMLKEFQSKYNKEKYLTDVINKDIKRIQEMLKELQSNSTKSNK